MIDNLKKSVNNKIQNIGKSLSKEKNFIFGLQTRANILLSTIKTKHANTNISDSQLLIYKTELNKLIASYNKIQKVALSIQSNLKTVDKIINTLNITVNSLNIILTTLQVLPIPAQFQTVGLIMIVSKKLNDASALVKQITGYVNSITVVIKVILDLFNTLLKLLDILNSTIQEIIELLQSKSKSFYTELQLEMNSDLESVILNNNSNIIGTYKDYIFILRPYNDPEYTVGTIKPNYAVAQLNGKDVYFSDKSYTLNPQILIDQLKLQIDKI